MTPLYVGYEKRSREVAPMHLSRHSRKMAYEPSGGGGGGDFALTESPANIAAPLPNLELSSESSSKEFAPSFLTSFKLYINASYI